MLCLLAVLGDTIVFLLVGQPRGGNAHRGEGMDRDIALNGWVPDISPREESGLADLVAGEAVVLGSCQGARPIDGTDTWHLNGKLGRFGLSMNPVLRRASRYERLALLYVREKRADGIEFGDVVGGRV
jgi:hypothetical protein